MGYHVGLLSEIPISNSLFLRIELAYHLKGFMFPSNFYNSGGIVGLNYISLPVLVRPKTSRRLSLVAGPEFGYLAYAKSRFSGSNYDITRNLRKFDFVLNVGPAIEFNDAVGLELRYGYGLLIIQDEAIFDSNGNSLGRAQVGPNRTLQLSLVYKFAKN